MLNLLRRLWSATPVPEPPVHEPEPEPEPEPAEAARTPEESRASALLDAALFVARERYMAEMMYRTWPDAAEANAWAARINGLRCAEALIDLLRTESFQEVHRRQLDAHRQARVSGLLGAMKRGERISPAVPRRRGTSSVNAADTEDVPTYTTKSTAIH